MYGTHDFAQVIVDKVVIPVRVLKLHDRPASSVSRHHSQTRDVLHLLGYLTRRESDLDRATVIQRVKPLRVGTSVGSEGSLGAARLACAIADVEVDREVAVVDDVCGPECCSGEWLWCDGCWLLREDINAGGGSGVGDRGFGVGGGCAALGEGGDEAGEDAEACDGG